MNKVILMGRITRDLELKHSGKEEPIPVLKFTLAVSRKYKKECRDIWYNRYFRSRDQYI